MASEGNPVQIPVANLVQGSAVVRPVNVQSGSGNSLPPRGSTAPGLGASPATTGTTPAGVAAAKVPAVANAQSLVDLLNKHMNDSGRPDQFRVAPLSGGRVIQQVNPANGQVIGEFAASEFPALARSLGTPGSLVDSRA